MRRQRRFPIRTRFLSSIREKNERAAGCEFRDDEFSIEINVILCVPTERKKDETKPSFCDTLTKRTMRYIKFSYLERVHALPVLVQVVHEIHDDDDVKKKQRISAEQSINGAKIVCQKSGLSNETHFLQFFICVL